MSFFVMLLINFGLKFEMIVLNEIIINFVKFLLEMKFFLFDGSGLGFFGSMGLIIFIWVLKGFGKFKVKLFGIINNFVVLNILLRLENLLFLI